MFQMEPQTKAGICQLHKLAKKKCICCLQSSELKDKVLGLLIFLRRTE